MFSILLQILVGFEIISVEHRAFASFFFNVIEQRFSRNVVNHCSVNLAVALYNAEYSLFIESASATISFALSTEVRLISLNLAAQFPKLLLSVFEYRNTI